MNEPVSFAVRCLSFLIWGVASVVLAAVMVIVGATILDLGGILVAGAVVVATFAGIGYFLKVPEFAFWSFSLTVLVALLLPAVQATRCSPTRIDCSKNLKQIALGLHHYHDTYKTFPSAFIPDADGEPIRSWRVLLLPFLDQIPLHEQFDVNQPWDAPANAALIDRCPQVYRCPIDDTELPGDTQYFAVVGAKSAWPGSEGRKFRDFTDGTMNTLMVVESHGRGVKWTEPRDLVFDDMQWKINAEPTGSGLSSIHLGGAHAALADGSVRFLSEKIDPETLRALVTAQGGEEITKDY